MKHFFLWSLFFCLALANAQACWYTSYIGGSMSYEQIGARTIRLKIVTYTRINLSGQNEQKVNWGDGNTETVLRNIYIDIGANVRRSEYIATHTYSFAPAQYLVSMQDTTTLDTANYAQNINNGAATIFPFYLETEVFLFETSINSSPRCQTYMMDKGVVGVTYQYTINATDLDGDSVAYQLVMPKYDRNTYLPFYSSPDMVGGAGNNGQLSLHPETGVLAWATPQLAGKYQVCIWVKSYREGVYMGGMFCMLQIEIFNPMPPITVPISIASSNPDVIHIDATHTGAIHFDFGVLGVCYIPIAKNISFYMPDTVISSQAMPDSVAVAYDWTPHFNPYLPYPQYAYVALRGSFEYWGNNGMASEDLGIYKVIRIVYRGINVPVQELENEETPAISIYPNPATDKLTIQLPEVPEKTTLAIFSTNGTMIHQELIPPLSNTHTWMIPNLPQGVYWLQMTNSKHHSTQSFVLQR